MEQRLNMKRSVIDTVDLTVEELDGIIKTAYDIIENPDKYAEKCKGKKLATLFFEPSTRTRLSFEAAMLELGGSVIGFSEANSSSASKGESIADTAKVISCYADIIAMRHPKEGSAYVASKNASIPVINAGDGAHCHPTQTLADLLTIHREKGRLNDLSVGFCGDLKYGRTVHSLINALSRDLESSLKNLDILYMTRIQRERFFDADEYERLKDSYVLTAEKMQLAKEDMCVLHPLPRVNEISVKVDEDKRACYFKQVLNGKYMRMALILKLLEDAQNGVAPTHDESHVIANKIRCVNPRCITSVEQELEHKFEPTDKEGVYKCLYCESEHKI